MNVKFTNGGGRVDWFLGESALFTNVAGTGSQAVCQPISAALWGFPWHEKYTNLTRRVHHSKERRHAQECVL